MGARAAPLLPIAIGLILGIAVDDLTHLTPWIYTMAFALGFATLLRFGRRSRLSLAGLGLLGMAIGGMRFALSDRYIRSHHIVRYCDAEPMLTRVRGRVVSPPRIEKPSRRPRYPGDADATTRFVLDADLLAGRSSPIQVTGLVAVTVHDAMMLLRDGDEVDVTGWMYPPRPPQNPGQYDWALHQRRNGIRVGLSVRHGESVRLAAPRSAASLADLVQRLRTHLRGYLLDDVFRDADDGAGVITAMVIGERSAVSQAMNDAFVRTGNAHFLAASGMNVAWLSLLGWFVLTRLAGWHYRTAAFGVAMLIVLFMLVAEPQPSILRASIVGLLACAAVIRRSAHHSLNWLAAAAILVLLIDPADVFRAAFQLSFVAVLGLIHVYPRVSRALARSCVQWGLPRMARAFDHDVELPITLLVPSLNPGKPGQLFHGGLHGFAGLLTLAATEWFLTAPLACYHFNIFAPWGWFGSFALWFIAIPTTIIGFVTVLAGAVLPSTGLVLRPLLGLSTRLMLGWVGLLARLPGNKLDGGSPSLAWVLFAYAAIWLWTYRPQWMPIRHGHKLALALVVLAWFVPLRWLRSERDALNVWMLAVGNGTATIIELPNGRVLAYDFGTRSGPDPAELGAAFLQSRGIRRIDTVFISHPDFDHYGGLPDLADRVQIGHVLVNEHFESLAGGDKSALRCLDALRARGIPVDTIHGRASLDDTGGVRADILWPPPIDEQRILDANDSSTVLRLEYDDRSILLTGDIAEFAMGRLMAETHLACDAVALPHHGSVVFSTASFLRAANPRVAVRSSGQPHRVTTNGIETINSNRQYLNTADVGCVRLTIRNGSMSIDAFANRASPGTN